METQPQSEEPQQLQLETFGAASGAMGTLTGSQTETQDQHQEQENRDLFVRLPPYPFTFTTFAKGRWVGRLLLDVFAKEFVRYSRAYFEA